MRAVRLGACQVVVNSIQSWIIFCINWMFEDGLIWCVCRSLLTQEGICLQLQPGFHFLEVAYPYVARRLLTDEDPALRERLFQVAP